MTGRDIDEWYACRTHRSWLVLLCLCVFGLWAWDLFLRSLNHPTLRCTCSKCSGWPFGPGTFRPSHATYSHDVTTSCIPWHHANVCTRFHNQEAYLDLLWIYHRITIDHVSQRGPYIFPLDIQWTVLLLLFMLCLWLFLWLFDMSVVAWEWINACSV